MRQLPPSCRAGDKLDHDPSATWPGKEWLTRLVAARTESSRTKIDYHHHLLADGAAEREGGRSGQGCSLRKQVSESQTRCSF